ncbi:hypothetical protein [Telmatospirillum sp. J64-1]|uniref:hypothetical protein n=1 Tax=Telmatospirillum sp. J64-1 TaxID=2502183 RepID=UPI00115C68A1|nr:hypothetical protein [Telmatospirillum sp. J64-1]
MAVEWGQAKIEVTALRDEILDRVNDGWPIRRIYDEFKAAGKITMSERRFYHYAEQLSAQMEPKKLTQGLPARPHLVPTAPTPTTLVKQNSSASKAAPTLAPAPAAPARSSLEGLPHEDQADFKALWSGKK